VAEADAGREKRALAVRSPVDLLIVHPLQQVAGNGAPFPAIENSDDTAHLVFRSKRMIPIERV
jgi:hypothetical protein